jgi:hypothetical protein
MKPAQNIEQYFVSKKFHDCIIFFIMDLVSQFVYIMLYLLACNESFHEIGASKVVAIERGYVLL